MPGFKVYWGDPCSEETMREALATYRHVSDPQELADGSTVTLLEQVNNYFVRDDGVVLFTFQWDDIITFDYQGTTRAQVVTRYANVRVIQRDSTFFLFEKPKHNFGFAVEQVSRRLYGSPRAISRPKITSNVIKDIELADSSSLHGETFERLSDRDSTLCIYGNLEVRNEDGGIDCSPLHDEYRGREKGTTQFKSRSTQHMIYLSGKKGTLTVRGAGVRPEDAEFYICTHLLPRLRDAADNEEEDLEDLIDSD